MIRPVPAACLDLLHTFEGSAGQHEAVPTKDPTGKWEIGWGHRLSGPSYPDAPITRAQADHLALNDLSLAADAAASALGPNTAFGLTEGQWGAVVDFTFNAGAQAFRTSTLCRLLRFGQYAAAADEFGKWVFAHDPEHGLVELAGLKRRRAAERTMFLS